MFVWHERCVVLTCDFAPHKNHDAKKRSCLFRIHVPIGVVYRRLAIRGV